MSFWTQVSGYMIVRNEIPEYGRYAGNDDWAGRTLEDPHNWISRILLKARENWAEDEDVKLHYLPDSLYIRWFKDGELEEDELVEFPKEDIKKLVFPHGSEGPLSLTIATDMDAGYALRWHVVFSGGLRDRENIKFIVDWWETLKKYLVIDSGHIQCESWDTYYTDTIYGDEPYTTSKKRYVHGSGPTQQ